jgi:hypothetical protein
MNRCIMQHDSRKRLFGALRARGYTDRWVRLAIASAALGRIVDTFTTLSDNEAARVIAALPPAKSV